ncbi:MAG: AAA family ATPase [Bacteroidota bacterium]
MILSTIELNGFRNFKSAIVNLNEKSLIIGANDVGKTNLIWALRLLLDKGLSEYDIEPRDADFYAYEETNNFKIKLRFENVTEDCVVSKLKGAISDDDKLILMYEGIRDPIIKSKSYKLFAGPSDEGLEEIQERYYRKVLNLRYISCRRDFHSYINKEKHNLFYIAKENRTGEQVADDDRLIGEISDSLTTIDAKIPQLTFVANATNTINTELKKLSLHHNRQDIVFNAGTSDIDNFIDDVSISSKKDGKNLLIGGDGRLNQVYLSLWAARNQISDENVQEVSLICIEEPEAHLHPHQQRKLSEYLSSSIHSQVIITSHSPQIASEYSPNSIVKLVDRGGGAYNFKIKLRFENVTEDCVVSKLKGAISDDDKLILMYEGIRDPIIKSKSYKLFAGPSDEGLEEIQERYYRKVLNLRYISCRRDFHSYINKEKHNLFYIAKENRTGEQVADDDRLIGEISDSLTTIDAKIPQLTFVANATNTINTELKKLSLHHNRQDIVFNAGTSDIDNFIDDVSISSKKDGKNLLIGGDGRLNQVYLSLWAARNQISDENVQEVSLICIEEPEAHLHPHQQRKLSEYLSSSIHSQVIITSHSPQIASEYSPNSIVKLVDRGGGAYAASNGCSRIIEEAFNDFGYRMSIIPAEAFFADVVLLVEGPSEELLYKTLSRQLGIDTDRLNISILMVDGIGFKTFIKILKSLEIEWVVRTDNDTFKIPRREEYRLAGVQRLISFYRENGRLDAVLDGLLVTHEANLSGFSIPVPQSAIDATDALMPELIKHNLYLSKVDLESDLYNSPIKGHLDAFHGNNIDEEAEAIDVVSRMKRKKAIFMYEFLKQHKDSLKQLENEQVSIPLKRCEEIVKGYHEADAAAV